MILQVNRYARLLDRLARWNPGPKAFHEDHTPPPTELDLQRIWQHQRLHREALELLDGRTIRVLHPGFWNREAGPDFNNAVLQFGTDPPKTGDVEIDLVPRSWQDHRHDRNPRYTKVLLHVVWKRLPAECPGPPLLPLEPFLDSTWSELAVWLDSDGAIPSIQSGQCSEPLKQLDLDAAHELLTQAALVRLHRKGQTLLARARQHGWRLALIEGLYGALGYKHNVWPMQYTGSCSIEIERTFALGSCPLTRVQAALFGIANLLPPDTAPCRPGNRPYIRELWDRWWRHRESWQCRILPAELWRLSGIRPANHPTRRLALGAHWILNPVLLAALEAWLASGIKPSKLVSSLQSILQSGPDPFWEHHWTLNSRRFDPPQPLLGPTRTTDLAMNIVLPWLWIRARAGENETLVRAAEHRYFNWPAGQDNAVLRLACERIFSANLRKIPRTAAAQQGLIQIVRDYCDQSNALCDQCGFPNIVQEWLF